MAAGEPIRAVPKPEGKKKKGNPNKQRATKMENRVAKRLGMERQPLSGGLKRFPGDVADKEWLLELKNYEVETTKGEKVATFKLEWMTKVMQEAEREKKFAALVYQYKGDSRYWVVMNLDDFERYVLQRESK